MNLITKVFLQMSRNRCFPQVFVFIFMITSLFACSVTENSTSANAKNPQQSQLSQNSLPQSISQTVLRNAARVSGLKISNLKITQVTSTSFSNPCIFQFGEVCTKEYNPIPGWIVILQVKEQSWIYHVNKSGSQILLDPKISNNQLPKKIANGVLSDASKGSGLPISSLKITQSTQKTFSNSCVFNFGEVCTQIFDPIKGWEVIVKVKNQFWTYHVDITGKRIVLDPQITKT
ncbi:hypothetical protein [Dolichospermum compactum]|uniref:Uncharacterized protein n=1 Tax=Dolichospermum compactum NIES-806 TaxID=1973481 RepID=A0A1Z4V4R5_9CYAN|nr:hypothetical protein [Dolichospermum compactum]BAZ86541.1 hypothetical protein NIES806_27540 [Dolichospermum compactum NIES-806]